MQRLRRVHRTPQGNVETRAFRLEDHAWRAEVQRDGDPITAVPGTTCASLEDAWRVAEHLVQRHFPHDCRGCEPVTFPVAAADRLAS